MTALAHRGAAAPAQRPRAFTIGGSAPLWRLERVLQEVPLSRSTIRRMEIAGTFPKRVRLSGNSVAWKSDEVQAWMAARRRVDST